MLIPVISTYPVSVEYRSHISNTQPCDESQVSQLWWILEDRGKSNNDPKDLRLTRTEFQKQPFVAPSPVQNLQQLLFHNT